MKKKKLSKSLKVLIVSSIILMIYTAIVLFLMAFMQMAEPQTLTLSFFGAFAVSEGINGAITHTKTKHDAQMEIINSRKGGCSENETVDN